MASENSAESPLMETIGVNNNNPSPISSSQTSIPTTACQADQLRSLRVINHVEHELVQVKTLLGELSPATLGDTPQLLQAQSDLKAEEEDNKAAIYPRHLKRKSVAMKTREHAKENNLQRSFQTGAQQTTGEIAIPHIKAEGDAREPTSALNPRSSEEMKNRLEENRRTIEARKSQISMAKHEREQEREELAERWQQREQNRQDQQDQEESMAERRQQREQGRQDLEKSMAKRLQEYEKDLEESMARRLQRREEDLKEARRLERRKLQRVESRTRRDRSSREMVIRTAGAERTAPGNEDNQDNPIFLYERPVIGSSSTTGDKTDHHLAQPSTAKDPRQQIGVSRPRILSEREQSDPVLKERIRERFSRVRVYEVQQARILARNRMEEIDAARKKLENW
jgi:hypothetical protein